MTSEKQPSSQYRKGENYSFLVTRDLKEQHHLDSDDQAFQAAIFSQLIDALSKYPNDKRFLYPVFHPFVFLLANDLMLLASVEGSWSSDPEENTETYLVKKVTIHHACKSLEELSSLSGTVQHFNPGVPKIGSSAFDENLDRLKEST